MLDMVGKGRQGEPLRGSRHPASRLTEEQAMRILALKGGSEKGVARMFGVTSRTVGFIWRREKWKHLQEPEVTK